MTKLALFNFVTKPGEVLRGVRRLGGRGAVLHALRRAGAATDKALLGPCQLRINPMGTVCNHSCPMCWLSQLSPDDRRAQERLDREQSMTLEQYVALLDGMPAGLTEVNVVGGGEPLAHKSCIEIMAEIKRRKLIGYLITNGSLMREPTARAMIDMGWDMARISTHAGDRETYEKVHATDHFELVRENLLRYDAMRRAAGRQKQCKLNLHFVLQRENLTGIANMFRLAEEVHADHVIFEIVFAFSPEILLRPEELGVAIEQLSACAAQARISSNAEEILPLLQRDQDAYLEATTAAEMARAEASTEPSAIDTQTADAASPPSVETAHETTDQLEAEAASEPQPAPYRPANRCSVGFDSAFITALGDVLPCCFSTEVMGNVKQQSFKEIWKGSKYRDFRSRLINGCFAEYCSRLRCKLTTFLHD